MKKSFTIAELLISVALLGIIVIFLFQALNITQTNTLFFQKQVDKIEALYDIETLISNDILYAKEIKPVSIKEQKSSALSGEANHILKIKTEHSLYNPFYTYVTYLVTKEKNLMRIEHHGTHFEKGTDFSKLDEAYITPLLSQVEFFRVSPIKNASGAYALYIKTNDKEIIFTTMMLNATSENNSGKENNDNNDASKESSKEEDSSNQKSEK